jgi:antitoxin component YwqK of YwqJK toxin-antitoxin module
MGIQGLGDFSEVEVVRERYSNGAVKIEREVTLDGEGNYVNHGAWKMWNAKGALIAEGQYDMGKRIGSWTRWHGRGEVPAMEKYPLNRFKPPLVSQVVFSDDMMEGEWLIVDADERKVKQVSLLAGKRNGTVTTWLPNGKIYRQGNYVNGVPVGDVLETDAKSGELKRVATYVEGRKIVTKTAHHKRGKQKKSEEMFLAATTVEKSADDFWSMKFAEYGSEGEDLRHGPAKAWFENGNVQSEGFYDYDKKDGTFTFWYANGQVAVSGEYDNDAPVGTWVWWHENGQKAAIGKYENGALVGQWRWWNDDGKLAEKKAYDGTETVSSDPQDVLKLGRAPETETTTR